MKVQENLTCDLSSTLTDMQVLEFCKNGYLMFEGVVPDEINRKTLECCEREGQSGFELRGILEQDWFRNNVILNAEVAGAVRSLLGSGFHLPVRIGNHRVKAPFERLGWHVDANCRHTCELNYVYVFYYPQDTPLELGPTRVLPGSHLLRHQTRFMEHLGSIRGTVSTEAPAGSIFITAYDIWHQRDRATGKGWRNLLKYFYWRTTPPVRDWIVDDRFDFATADYSSPITDLGEQFRMDINVAAMFLWLCGRSEDFQNLGGSSWPAARGSIGAAYGFPEALRRNR